MHESLHSLMSKSQFTLDTQDSVQEYSGHLPRVPGTMMSAWSKRKVVPTASEICEENLALRRSTSLQEPPDAVNILQHSPSGSEPSRAQDILSPKTSDSDLPQNRTERIYSQLPVGWWLLYDVKKMSRWVSLLLCLTAFVINSFICLGLPWTHFRVPLYPPQNNSETPAIIISTIFFMHCSDISCRHEYDHNAYFLDFAMFSFILASIASVCLCITLINIIFFTNSNFPMLDLFSLILSFLTATSMILGILFYLLQVDHFLQEGMTYRLGVSFYLAWITVFLFLVIGFSSYLNYNNFWSVLALHSL